MHATKRFLSVSAVLMASVALMGTASHAGNFDETHLNEISAPALEYVQTRVAELEGQGTLTRTERRELRTLKRAAKRLTRTATRLRVDFGELRTAAGTAVRLKDAGVPMLPSVDEGFALAELALGEREAFVRDHFAFITIPRSRNVILRQLGRYETVREKADSAPNASVRARILAQSERLLTATLGRAQRFARRDTALLPPTRYRSGDFFGPPGGRLAIPSESESEIAGHSLIIPPGALSGLPVRVTMEVAPSFVEGDDTPIGQAVRIGPPGLDASGEFDLVVPVQLPVDADLARLALFKKVGDTVTSVVGGTIQADGTYVGTVDEPADYQPGLRAPPPGTPDGLYHVVTVLYAVNPDATGQDLTVHAASAFANDFRFRADGTATRMLGGSRLVSRRFTGSSPHHDDQAGNTLAGSADFTWNSTGAGRFEFTFREGLDDADAVGVVSTDNEIIAFSGAGPTFEFLAVGVRATTGVTTGDLSGRWLETQLGMELMGGLTTPFSTRLEGRLRFFDADGVDAIQYDSLGQRLRTDLSYNTNLPSLLHTRSASSTQDGGSETFTLFDNGAFNADDGARTGFLNPTAGVLVTIGSNVTDQSVALGVAVLQPGGGQADGPQGLFNFVGLDVGFEADGSTTSSAFTARPQNGMFDVSGTDLATITTAVSERGVFTIDGPAPLGDIPWASARSAVSISGGTSQVQLTPDGNGNHLAPDDSRWYGVSGSGGVLLGTVPGSDDDPLRGIFIGLK